LPVGLIKNCRTGRLLKSYCRKIPRRKKTRRETDFAVAGKNISDENAGLPLYVTPKKIKRLHPHMRNHLREWL